MPSTVALLGVAIMSCVMSAAVLGSLLRAGVAGVSRWCAAYGMFAGALALVIAGAHLPVWLGAIAAHTLFVGGSLVILQGVREFFGRPLASAAEYAALYARLPRPKETTT